MSGLTFEQLRLPAALILVIVAAFVFMPRDGGPASTAATADGAASAPAAGQPGGAVTSSGTPPAATPVPTLTPAEEAAASRSPDATPEPEADDGFTAEVLACRSISGSDCNGQLGTLQAGAATFTALVRFTDATAGDVISVTVSGEGGTIAGGPYTLGGSGDGYYYANVNVGGLPGGDYDLIATRNGEEVASTTFRRGG